MLSMTVEMTSVVAEPLDSDPVQVGQQMCSSTGVVPSAQGTVSARASRTATPARHMLATALRSYCHDKHGQYHTSAPAYTVRTMVVTTLPKPVYHVAPGKGDATRWHDHAVHGQIKYCEDVEGATQEVLPLETASQQNIDIPSKNCWPCLLWYHP